MLRQCPMVSVYLAAPYASKDQIRRHASELVALGCDVTAQWLDEPHAATVPFTSRDPEELRAFARRDISDIARADVFIFFSLDPDQPTKRGGRHVEFGLAIAQRKRMIVVGPRENIFHFLPDVEVAPTFNAAIELLGVRSPSSISGGSLTR